MSSRPRVTCVIMAGGTGERLWPLVRTTVPKACLSIDGRRSLLALTLARLRPVAVQAPVLIVTTSSQARSIRATLPASARRVILVEPQPKNTAACIALAAATLAQRDPTQVMVVLPADQWVSPTVAFQRSVWAAIDAAHAHGRIVTIGVRPTRVHTGLGYLRAGQPLGEQHGCGVFRLERFDEKPSAQVARRLLRDPRVYWNTGTFVGRVATFLELIARWLPEHARRVFPLGEVAGRSGFARRAHLAYRPLRAVSFDAGVMAHVREAVMVEGRFVWEDLGSWDSWIRIRQTRQPGLAVASRNVHVVTPDGHLVAAVGLKELLVVHTPDATLICHPDCTQQVRAIASRIARDPRLVRYA